MVGKLMAKKGITTKILSNGSKHIYVRFKHNGTNYGVKNFTKLFGCRTENSAFEKLCEVRVSLTKGINPFDDKSTILNDLWDKKLLTVKWKENTKRHYINYYDIVIRNTLGKKSLHKITAQDVSNLKIQYYHKSVSYQNRIKSIISPIIDEEIITNNEINYNPLSILKNTRAPSAKPISDKVIEDATTIAKKIYTKLINNDVKYISNYHHSEYDNDEETNALFLLMLLTVHRFGELLQLRKKDIYYDNNNYRIVSPKEITKTNISYQFPLPSELTRYIENIKDKDDLLFPNLNRGKVSVRFKKLIQSLELTVINNKTLSAHDLRRIFTSILAKNKVDISLIDYALEHQIKNVMKHYLHYDYEDKREVFNKYWSLIKE